MSIFREMTPLAWKHNAINLGQGFPGMPCEDFVKDALVTATRSDVN